MRKILIVSPRFPPTNAADLHRVRVSLAHYGRFGWEPTVLCVDPATSDCPDDPMLARSLPQDTRVERVKAWSEAKCRRFGFGQLGYRSLLPLYRAGRRLLNSGDYSVVFFSTTVFSSFVLGPLWKRQYGCSVVYDFHDPWYSEELLYTRETAPGTWWKYRVDQQLAKYLERFSLRHADHIVCVSEADAQALSGRYPHLGSGKFTVLPFAAASGDYDFLRAQQIAQTVFQADRAIVRWTYAGAIAPDMAPVLSVLFDSLARLRRESTRPATPLRLHFVGTSYVPSERATKRVTALAREHGIEDLVEEISERIPYFEALKLYQESDGILLIGSVHAGYTASKLMTCVLSKQPILALFHRDSLVSKIAAQFPNVFLACFDETPDEPAFHAQVANGIKWLRAPRFEAAAIDARLEPWSAAEMTRRLCAIFDRETAARVPADALSKAPSAAR